MHIVTDMCNATTRAYIYIVLAISDDCQNCHAMDML
jgi:hypothetical protein